MKLLVADDDAHVQRLVRHLAEDESLLFETFASTDRRATVAAVDGLQPDVVMLRGLTPDDWGVEVCKTLRVNSATAALPVIMRTGFDHIPDGFDGFGARADFYLTKSRFVGDLLRALRRIVTASKRSDLVPDERYRELFAGARDIVYTHDLRGNLTSINPAAERLAGYEPSELLGLNISALVAPEYLPSVRAAMAAKISGSGPTTYEIELVAKDGRRIPVEIASRVIFRNGIPVEIAGIARDLTEQRRAEARAFRYAASLRRAKQRQGAAGRARRDLIARLRGLVGAGRLRVVFQPVIDLTDGRIVGQEALSRFDHEQPRSPDAWFREAAALGIGIEIELAAVRNALRVAAVLPEEMFVAINVSPEVVLADEFAQTLAPLAPSRVVVEVTEHAAVEDYVAVSTALKPLREMGLRLSIDDVGSGYASLRHILQLSPDIIKLDATITRSIDSDPNRRSLATALISFGAAIDADVIAEGIESDIQLRTLRKLGVRYGQGYLLGRPGLLPPRDEGVTLRPSAGAE